MGPDHTSSRTSQSEKAQGKQTQQNLKQKQRVKIVMGKIADQLQNVQVIKLVSETISKGDLVNGHRISTLWSDTNLHHQMWPFHPLHLCLLPATVISANPFSLLPHYPASPVLQLFICPVLNRFYLKYHTISDQLRLISDHTISLMSDYYNISIRLS